MAKVSNIISSYVVSVFNGQTEGVVSNILFNEKKKAKYLIISQNDETFLMLDTKDIYALGDGAVIIKNSQVLHMYESKLLESKNCFSPINSIVVNLNGDFLGYVSDIELNEKYAILNISVGSDKTIGLDDVVNVTDSAILTCLGVNKPRLASFKTRTKIPTNIDDGKVSIMDEIKPNETILPSRSITNYNFLINRKVNRDILNFNGEIIIKENQIINSKILDIARVNGKIRELTKYSI